MDDEEVDEKFPGLGDTLKELIVAVGFTPPPEDDTRELYDLLVSGHCMACRAPLGERTILLLAEKGIAAGYCSGPCVQDIAVLGWLQEQYQDVIDSIRFRSGEGDQPGT